MKRGVKTLACLLCAMAFSALYAQNADTVTWKMSVRRWAGGSYESAPFRAPIQMKLDDTFQISIESERDCHCYVLIEDSSGTISILANSSLKAKIPLTLPSRDQDFVIESAPGTDRFYVIVSRNAQAPLEKALKALSGGGEADATAMAKVKDEILRIKQSLSTVASEAEKPAAMGGVTRGSAAPEATQFEGRSTYVKTITIKY